MKICNHSVDSSQIIGIGPLISVKSTAAYFAHRTYFFMLHCKHQSIKIESEFFLTDQEKDLAAEKEFRNQYCKAHDMILGLIHEPA